MHTKVDGFKITTGYGQSIFSHISNNLLPRSQMNVFYATPYEASSPFYQPSTNETELSFPQFAQRLATTDWGTRYLVTSDYYNAPKYDIMRQALLSSRNLHLILSSSKALLHDVAYSNPKASTPSLKFDVIFYQLSKYSLGFAPVDAVTPMAQYISDNIITDTRGVYVEVYSDYSEYSDYIFSIGLNERQDLNLANKWYLDSLYSRFKNA